jgi:hypothetical protein
MALQLLKLTCLVLITLLSSGDAFATIEPESTSPISAKCPHRGRSDGSHGNGCRPKTASNIPASGLGFVFQGWLKKPVLTL